MRTGDRAELLPGRRIRITGRLKSTVIRKGMKISLAEIDSAAVELGDCAAFALPDDETGERLALAVREPCRAAELSGGAGSAVRGRAGDLEAPEQIVGRAGEFPHRSGKSSGVRSPTSRWAAVVYAPRLSGPSGGRVV